MSSTIKPDLKDAHIQDIASVLAKRYSKNALYDIIRRFEAEDIAREAANSDDLPRANSNRQRLQNWLRVANGTPEGRKIIAYMIENAQLRIDQIEALEDAFAGSRFVLQEGEYGMELMLRITATAEAEVKDQRAYLDETAPEAVLGHIEEAESKLTKGDYEEAMAEAREALSAMAEGNYAQALDELHTEGVIKKWDGNGNRQRFDWEMLYMPYGYCSTLGSHRDDPNALQAETGVILVEEAVHFLLRSLEQARKDNTHLQEWAV